jgi:hypothetical protein
MTNSSVPDTWRDPILAQFTLDIATVARLTVVADPDGLLTEQGIVDGIRQRGFEVVPFEDHVAFRYAFERRFRQAWDCGSATNLVVVLRAPRSDISELPFDLLDHARRDGRLLSFSLAEMFPALAPHVLSVLDRAELDLVFAAQQLFKPEPLGENATRDFLLRNIFRLDPAQIQSDADLLRALLRRHYSGQVIAKSLDDRFIYLLRCTGRWSDWPLDQIVSNRVNFLEFLQERWPIFVRQILNAQAGGAEEAPEPFELKYSGPSELPFDHDDVRVYIDNLFTDGLLIPIGGVAMPLVDGTWIAVGVKSSGAADHLIRLRKLLELLAADKLSSRNTHQEWMQAAIRWAEVVALRWSIPGEIGAEEKDQFTAARRRSHKTAHEMTKNASAEAAGLTPPVQPVAPWRITHVEVLPGFRLHVGFNDGTEGDLELAGFLNSGSAGVFAALRDANLFAQARIECGAVTWPGDLALAPDAMHRAIKEHGTWSVE